MWIHIKTQEWKELAENLHAMNFVKFKTLLTNSNIPDSFEWRFRLTSVKINYNEKY